MKEDLLIPSDEKFDDRRQDVVEGLFKKYEEIKI